jgi:hypothetical protein
MPSGTRLRVSAAAVLCSTAAGALTIWLIHVPRASAGAHRGEMTRTASTARATTPAPDVVVARGTRARPGSRGPRGYRGPPGYRGPRGRTGPQGFEGPFDDTVTINWQNGRQSDGDSAEFAIPGIGEGELVCSETAQWLRVFPIDEHDEVTMWLVRQQDGTAPTVRTARHNQYTGPDFNEGLNRYRGQPVTTGSFAGLISSRGPWTGPGGPGPPPTSFRISFNWNFTHRASARCYVAAQFITGA